MDLSQKDPGNRSPVQNSLILSKGDIACNLIFPFAQIFQISSNSSSAVDKTSESNSRACCDPPKAIHFSNLLPADSTVGVQCGTFRWSPECFV